MKQTNLSVLKNGKRVIVKTMLALLILVLMVGCGGKGDFSLVTKEDISTARLVGYDPIPFEKVMENFVVNKFKRGENDSNLAYGWKKGWVGDYAPDSENLTSNEVAMSYFITTVLYEEEEQELYSAIIYMIHNTKENTLTLKGGLRIQDGEEYYIDLNEAYDSLDRVFNEYK